MPKISPPPALAFEMLYDHYCAQILSLLKQSNRNFYLLCDMHRVSFEPPVSKEDGLGFGRMNHFVISGSSFESFKLYEDSLGQYFVQFLVGIMPEYDTLVNVRVRGIYQILIKDTIDTDRMLFSRVDSGLIFDAKSTKEPPKQNPTFTKAEEESLHTILAKAHNRKVFEHLINAKHT